MKLMRGQSWKRNDKSSRFKNSSLNKIKKGTIVPVVGNSNPFHVVFEYRKCYKLVPRILFFECFDLLF